MYLFKKQTWLTAGLLLTLSACGGSGGDTVDTTTATTSVDVFDGAAIGCSVSSDGTVATEVGEGAYTFASVLDAGTVVTATGCTDTDTQSLLPTLSGVVQSGAVVISPITTLIVEAAIANGARSISATALETAIARIVANLGLGDYKPTDPATANYVAAAKADTTGTSTAAVAMRISLAISTLLKSVEVSAGPADASAAITAITLAISNAPVDLTSPTSITTMMEAAASTLGSTVAAAVATATTAVASSVAAIAGTTGSIDDAIAATTAVSTILNTADETTIATIDLLAAVETVIINLPPQADSVTITDGNGDSVVVGDRLSGTYTYADTDGDAEGTSTYRWLLEGSPITGATSLEYVIVIGDLNKAISFEVSPIAATGTPSGSAVTSTTITVDKLANCILDESTLDYCLLQ
jgi:hypothetical protein